MCIPLGETFSLVPRSKSSVKMKYRGRNFQKMEVAGTFRFQTHSCFSSKQFIHYYLQSCSADLNILLTCNFSVALTPSHECSKPSLLYGNQHKFLLFMWAVKNPVYKYKSYIMYLSTNLNKKYVIVFKRADKM